MRAASRRKGEGADALLNGQTGKGAGVSDRVLFPHTAVANAREA
jgi:hypothetical protein